MEQHDSQQSLSSIITNKYKYAATYGLYLGAGLAVIYFIGILFPQNAFINILCSLGQISILIYGYYLVRQYRDKACGGYITFGHAWSFGVWLFVFMALIMSVAHYIHFQFIQPDFISQQYNQILILLDEMNYPAEELDVFIKKGVPSAIQMTFFFIWFYIIGGAFLSLIYAAIARKADTLEENHHDSDHQDAAIS